MWYKLSMVVKAKSSTIQDFTLREQRFIQNYLETGKKQQAAIDAGYPEKSAHVYASRLLRKAKIKAVIEKYRQELKDDLIMSLTERKIKLSDIARENIHSAKGTLLRGGNVSAIKELNLMEGVYENTGLVVDNRQYNIIVDSERTKNYLEQAQTGKLPQLTDPALLQPPEGKPDEDIEEIAELTEYSKDILHNK